MDEQRYPPLELHDDQDPSQHFLDFSFLARFLSGRRLKERTIQSWLHLTS
jgi:hypothetical protein